MKQLTREEKIQAIYEKVADKALDFWCKTNLWIIVWKFHLNNDLFFALKVDYNTSYYEYIDDNILNAKHQNYIKVWIKYYKYINSSEVLPIEPSQLENNKPISFTIYPDNFKIIWHPVMFGNMVNYFEINNIQLYNEYFHNIVHFEWVLEEFTKLWKEKRKPIEEQSDECINFIHSLLKDE